MNYDVITKSTNAMWRYATNNDKRLGKAVEKYLKEGLEAPGIAKYLEIENMADYFADRAKYMDSVSYPMRIKDHLIELKNVLLAPIRIMKTIARDKNLRKLYREFENKYKLYYPNSWNKRSIILYKIVRFKSN